MSEFWDDHINTTALRTLLFHDLNLRNRRDISDLACLSQPYLNDLCTGAESNECMCGLQLSNCLCRVGQWQDLSGLSYSWSLWSGFSVSADSCKDSALSPGIVAMRLGSLFSFWYNSCCCAVLYHHFF